VPLSTRFEGAENRVGIINRNNIFYLQAVGGTHLPSFKEKKNWSSKRMDLAPI
jgi:hypothetical protein